MEQITPRMRRIGPTLESGQGPNCLIPKSWKGRFAYTAAASLWGKMNSNSECFTTRVLPNYACFRALKKKKKDPLGFVDHQYASQTKSRVNAPLLPPFEATDSPGNSWPPTRFPPGHPRGGRCLRQGQPSTGPPFLAIRLREGLAFQRRLIPR